MKLFSRREFANLIVKSLTDHGYDLDVQGVYDRCLKQICECFEKELESERSIGIAQVEKAIEYCLRSGYDETETVFSVISALEVPKLEYNVDKKIYTFSNRGKPSLLSEADDRAKLFLNRYSAIKYRVQKSFHQKNMFIEEKEKTVLQTVDFLLTISHRELNRNLILGALLRGTNGKYLLEDPTGIIELDLRHAE